MRRLLLSCGPAVLHGQSYRLWAVPAAVLWTWLSLLAFVLPYDPDEAVYSAIASGIVDGRWPYRDLFDHKPPLVYLWYLPAGLGAPVVVERLLATTAVVASFPRCRAQWALASHPHRGPHRVGLRLVAGEPFPEVGREQ